MRFAVCSTFVLFAILFCGVIERSVCLEDSNVVDENDTSEILREEMPSVEKVLLTEEQVSKLSGKELRRILQRKGRPCKGCTEKSDFVALVLATQDLPDIEVPPVVEENKGLNKEQIDEIMRDLERHGYAKDGKIIKTGSDFENMTPDEVTARMNMARPGYKAPKKATAKDSKKNKASSTNKKTADKTAKKDSSDGFADDDDDDDEEVDLNDDEMKESKPNGKPSSNSGSNSKASTTKKATTKEKTKSTTASSSSTTAGGSSKKPDLKTKPKVPSSGSSSNSGKSSGSSSSSSKAKKSPPAKKAKATPPPPPQEDFEETIEL